MASNLSADKPREFHCDGCGSRCTHSLESDKEYGHHYHCPRREELGMRQPPRYSGAISTYTGGDWECPSCDYDCGSKYVLQSHHAVEHGNRAAMSECRRCGVTVIVGTNASHATRCLPCYAVTDPHPEMIDADPTDAVDLATDGGERDV